MITGAALIMVAVFAGFAAGQLVMFQQMGFGLGVAMLLDATIVRTILMPACDGAARPLELVPAELAGVAAAPQHRGLPAAPPAAAPGPAGPETTGGPGLESIPADERAA